MKKFLLVMSIICVLTIAMATVAYATGSPSPTDAPAAAPSATNSVAQIIQDGFDKVKTQTEEIVFDVVLWVLIAATIIFLLVKIVSAVLAHRQGAGFSVFPIIAAAVILILLLVLPRALWALL